MTAYQVTISDDAGGHVSGLDTSLINSLTYQIVESAVGVLTLTAPRVLDWDALRPDMILVVERDAGGGMLVDANQAWFLRDWEFSEDQNRNEWMTLTAYSGNYLLGGRVVAYNAGSAEAEKTAAIDNMMKAIVRENLGSSATDTARRLAGLTVAADLGLAPSTTKAFSRKKLDDVLENLALASWQAGTYLAYDTVYTGAGAFEFRTYTGQRGTNHGSNTSDVRNVRLDSPGLLKTHGGERNYVYAAGQGQESARAVVGVTNAAWVGASRWNRRELVVDGRNTDDTAALTEEGNAALYENRPRLILTGTIAESDGQRYGIDYGFGDIVSTKYGNFTFDCHVSAVKVSYVAGKEAIEARVRGEL